MNDRMPLPLAQADPEVAAAIDHETLRQHEGLEMIASENFVSEAVLEAAGSVFTNKYAEGYPGRRYYGGCEYADIVENLARDRAKQLFGAEHANVQPHSGSQANASAYAAILQPGDTILGLDLSHGGHLTHGHRLSFSGKLYRPTFYQVRRDTELIDYDELEAIAERERPKVIIGGGSAYPRLWDFARMRQIADKVGAKYIFDMAHIAGLVAGGVHPSPVPHAHITTTTTHKTLRGPRAGLVICGQDLAAAIDKAVFPGQQGGPLCTSLPPRRWHWARLCGPNSGLTPRRSWPTPRYLPRLCRRQVSASYPAAPITTSCSSMSSRKVSSAPRLKLLWARRALLSTRTQFPGTPTLRSSPPASASARRPDDARHERTGDASDWRVDCAELSKIRSDDTALERGFAAKWLNCLTSSRFMPGDGPVP